MKKAVILLPIILTLLLAACTPDIVKQGGVVVRGSAEPESISRIGVSSSEQEGSDSSDISLSSEDSESSYDGEYIVYTTKTGTKYHREDCGHLSKSKIPISLEQAKQQGLQPCSVCDPPT